MWKLLLAIPALLLVGILILLFKVPMTLGILSNSIFGMGIDTPAEMTRQARFQLPPGFNLGLYARDLPGVRFMAFSRNGDLLVARPRDGEVTLLRDPEGDGVANSIETLIDGLTRPHSIDFHDDWLYIAESNAIGRIKFNHEEGRTAGRYEPVITGLSDKGNHWSKTIRFGPDGMLYLSVGSSCNVCLEEDAERATITRYQPDGSGKERVATGLRNSVGMDWAPFDQQLYATDNGRDLLGDDYPPCELNRIEMGGFYGWPYVNASGDLDPDFGDATKLLTATSPVHEFRPHNAPLGIRFINHLAWQDDYKDAALVALHGSWNRSTHDGYKVVSLHRRDDGSFDERDFFTGFELAGDVIGRPVDIAIGLDNCAYISDDYAGAIYRVCYGQEALSTQAMPIGKTTKATAATGLDGIEPSRLAMLKQRGEELYMTRGCPACHTLGTEGTGLKPLKSIARKYTVDSLAKYYNAPTPPMPPVLFNDEDELAMSAWLLGL